MPTHHDVLMGLLLAAAVIAACVFIDPYLQQFAEQFTQALFP